MGRLPLRRLGASLYLGIIYLTKLERLVYPNLISAQYAEI